MSTKDIKALIDVDVKYNLTPDLPKLRFYGHGIPVFLWDGLQDYSTITTIIGCTDMTNNYESKFYNALTVNKFVPWYNMDDSKDSYAAYCLEEHEDVALLEVPEYTIGTPLQMKGKICLVSVLALQELDMYYENDSIFTRTEIDVYSSQYTRTPMRVFTWLNSADQISSFDNETSEYILDKNIDLTPFKDTTVNGVNYYEM
jgi:hypothetical protein